MPENKGGMDLASLVSEVIDGVPAKEKQRIARVAELFAGLQKTEAFRELEKCVAVFRGAVNDMAFMQPERIEYLKGLRVGLEVVSDIVHINLERAERLAEAERAERKDDGDNADVIRAMVSDLGGQVAETFE